MTSRDVLGLLKGTDGRCVETLHDLKEILDSP